MLEDKNIEIVYVGNVHSYRRAIGEKCLLANKHVLLEKPFACDSKDAEYLISLAKERNLFIMEGMWTRFFPAVELARRLVLGNGAGQPGVIGDVVSVTSDFNFNASDNNDEYPSSILYNRKEGGGASLFIAPYPIAAALLFFNGSKPDKICAVGQVDNHTGVDLQASMSLSFPPTSSIVPILDRTGLNENTVKLPG
jgi:dihydrodiol dehydrogenase / D-xylose 1-dehydrogenase (NADP)